ncbi:hypothetical protein HY633_01260 [Candidatus Uhrbacteria bacterium]|nr:hypothetical protein [Candidatus Uhrbacteria bacterium]
MTTTEAVIQTAPQSNATAASDQAAEVWKCRKDGHDGTRQSRLMVRNPKGTDLHLVSEGTLLPLVICEICRVKEIYARQASKKPIGATMVLEDLLHARSTKTGVAKLKSAAAAKEAQTREAVIKVAAEIISGRITLVKREAGDELLCGSPNGTPCCNRKMPAKAFIGESGICEVLAKGVREAGGLYCRDRAQALKIRNNADRTAALTAYAERVAQGFGGPVRRTDADHVLVCGGDMDLPCCDKTDPASSHVAIQGRAVGVCGALRHFFRQEDIRTFNTLAAAKEEALLFYQPGGVAPRQYRR